MGPPGLWAELWRQGAAKRLHGPEVERLLKGKKVAVDGAVWLYEAQKQADLVQAYGNERAALKVTFERCVRWLRKGVLPVIVLEGSGGGRASRTFSRGRGALGSAFAAQPEVQALLLALGIPCVNAEGEAEATCAALVAAGDCDFVATTDFDALLFGAPRVLRELDLLQGVASTCELWEAATIERVTGLNRHALVAAAFLAGCDYDCRSLTRRTSHDGEGVRGVGARQAVKIAHALSIESSGDALKGLAGRFFDARIPEVSTSRKLCRTMSAPEAQATRQDSFSDLAEAKKKAQTSRMLSRTMSRADEDPRCREGFTAAVRQYNRVVSGAMSACTADQPFAWKGVNDAAAEQILNKVFPGRAYEKLDPLHLEWALRVVAAECPAAICRDPVQRRNWAATRGLRYVPLSAKRPNRRQSLGVAYVLVEFALVNGDAKPVRMQAQKKHARVSLAEACRLLTGASRKSSGNKNQRSLKDMFQGGTKNAMAAHTSSACSSAPVAKMPSLAGESGSASTSLCQPQGSKQRKPRLARRELGHQLRLSRFRRQSVRTSRCVGDQKCSAGDSDGTLPEAVDRQGTLTKPVERQSARTSPCFGDQECPTGCDEGTLTKPVDLKLQVGGTIAENVGDVASGPTALIPVAANISLSSAVCISSPSKRVECRAAASACRTPSACPRDTTPENIAKFFGCSWLPSHQESSPAQSHDTCTGPSLDRMTVRERPLSAEQPPQYTSECVKHLAIDRRHESQSSPHSERPVSADRKAASVPNIWQRDSSEFISRWSPSTPHCSSRSEVSETPKKRRRPLSFGGFCRPEQSDDAEVSTPLKSASLLPIPSYSSGKRRRSNSLEDLRTNLAMIPTVVDLTQADPTGTDADSDDELPLASLIKKHDGMRSLRVLGRATTI